MKFHCHQFCLFVINMLLQVASVEHFVIEDDMDALIDAATGLDTKKQIQKLNSYSSISFYFCYFDAVKFHFSFIF